MRVLVVGPTGYIGKFVTRELVKRGYNTVALARERSGVKGKASAEDTRQVPLAVEPDCSAPTCHPAPLIPGLEGADASPAAARACCRSDTADKSMAASSAHLPKKGQTRYCTAVCASRGPRTLESSEEAGDQDYVTRKCSTSLIDPHQHQRIYICRINASQELEGADVRFGNVSDPQSLAATAFSEPVDVVVSCLASRTGGKVPNKSQTENRSESRVRKGNCNVRGLRV